MSVFIFIFLILIWASKFRESSQRLINLLSSGFLMVAPAKQLQDRIIIHEQPSLGICGQDPKNFYSCYEQSGRSNQTKYPSLPYLECEAWSYYAVDVAHQDIVADSIHQTQHGIFAKIKGGQHRVIDVTFPACENLWHVKNVVEERPLLTLIHVSLENYLYLPIKKENIRTGFFLRTANQQEQITAKMPVDDIAAEAVVEHFFSLVGEYCASPQLFPRLKTAFEQQGLKYWLR